MPPVVETLWRTSTAATTRSGDISTSRTPTQYAAGRRDALADFDLRNDPLGRHLDQPHADLAREGRVEQRLHSRHLVHDSILPDPRTQPVMSA
jgi:hypothetical protein